jgi:hypothetical protein
MRVAVLLFGQPRFFEYTVNRIKEEFNIPNHKFEYFIHFWEDVGFTPNDDRNRKYITSNTLLEDINILNPIAFNINKYDVLDEFTINFNNIIQFLNKGQIGGHRPYDTKSRYSYGQHLSLKIAYSLMQEYEKKNKIKYDTVIKARTDFIYKDIKCYDEECEYISDKTNQYILDKNLGDNYIKASGCAQQAFDVSTNTWNIVEKYKIFDPKSTKYKRDLYNIIRSGDVGLTTTRIAAEQYFNRWFDTFLHTYINDIRNNVNNPELQLYRRHDGLQGQIAILNDIKIVQPKKSRDHRIVLKDNCKEKWIKPKTIILDNLNNPEKDITEQLLSKHQKKL